MKRTRTNLFNSAQICPFWHTLGCLREHGGAATASAAWSPTEHLTDTILCQHKGTHKNILNNGYQFRSKLMWYVTFLSWYNSADMTWNSLRQVGQHPPNTQPNLCPPVRARCVFRVCTLYVQECWGTLVRGCGCSARCTLKIVHFVTWVPYIHI